MTTSAHAARVIDDVAAAVAFPRGGTPVANTTLNNSAIDVPASLLTGVTVATDNPEAALVDPGYYPASDFTGSRPGKP